MAEQTLGRDGLTDTKLSLSGPLNDELAYRLSARSRRQDAQMEGEFNDSEYNQLDKQSYRAVIDWTPSDDVLIRGITYYNLADSYSNTADVYLDPASNLSLLTQALNGGRFENLNPNDQKVSLSGPTNNRTEALGASVQVEIDFDGFLLTSITGYQEWSLQGVEDSDLTSLDLLTVHSEFSEESVSQEFRLTSLSGEKLDWLVGLFYFNSKLTQGDANSPALQVGNGFEAFSSSATPYLTNTARCTLGDLGACALASSYATTALPYLAFTPGSELYREGTIDSESLALFGQASYNFSDATKVTAGLRYGYETKDFYHATELNLVDSPFGNQFLRSISGTAQGRDNLSDSSVTGMISLNHLVGDAMFYATVATGTKSGGFNGDISLMPLEERRYDSEETTNFEVGAKIEGMLDGRARVNISYFYTEYEDFQSPTFDPETASFRIRNAGRQVTQGVDLDAVFAVTQGLTLTARIEYLDARYRDNREAGCNPDAELEHNITPSGTCNLDDVRMANAPNWSGSLAADYVHPLDAAELYLHSNFSFKSDYMADPTYAPYAKDTNYEILNVSAGIRYDHWDLSFWGKNITDKEYAVAHSGNVAATGLGAGGSESYRRWLNQPATFGVTLRYQY